MEKVTAVVCLGFPYLGLGESCGDVEDPLLDIGSPTMFIIGQHSATCTIDDIEDMREKMKVETNLLVVGGSDSLLRMSHGKRKTEGVTQSMVDRCILVSGSESVIVLSRLMDGELWISSEIITKKNIKEVFVIQRLC